MLGRIIEKIFLFLHCISFYTYMANKSLFIILSILLLGCGKHKTTYTSLIQIDSLLKEELTDSALHEVMRINPATLSENELAYYQLLKVQSQYKSYIPINSDSVINQVIDYYKGTNDIEKLARAYYYKAGILLDLGKTKQALICLKEAEKILLGTDYDILHHNIYFMIAVINSRHQEYQLALESSLKALSFSSKLGKKDYICHDYEKISVYYEYVGKKDSALHYINMCIAMIDNIPSKPAINRGGIWGNLGASYMSVDINKAKTYLLKADSIAPQSNVCQCLADIYLQQGDTAKAKEYIIKGISINESPEFKINNIKRLSKLEQEIGNYKRANELLQQAQQLKDSLTQKLREDNVKALQLEYDKNSEQKHTDTLLIYAIVGIFFVLLLGFAISVILARQSAKAKEKAKAEERHAVELENYAKQIEEQERLSNKELKTANRQLAKMKQEVKETGKEQRQQKKILERGHLLYSELMAGGNIGQWQRQDVSDFIGYFRLTNSEYAENIDQQYTDLTPTQSILTILEYIGKDDQEIMHILCLTEGALRTQRSRLRQRKSCLID